MPSLDLDNLSWTESPRKIEFGADMVIADVAITQNETLTLFTTKEGMELIKGSKFDKYTDIVDYAHPLIAIQKTLKEVDELCNNNSLKEAKKLVESLPIVLKELQQNLNKMIETNNQRQMDLLFPGAA
jgi:soluble cytochrome b562